MDNPEHFLIEQNNRECANGILLHILRIKPHSRAISVSGCRNYPEVHGPVTVALPRKNYSKRLPVIAMRNVQLSNLNPTAENLLFLYFLRWSSRLLQPFTVKFLLSFILYSTISLVL